VILADAGALNGCNMAIMLANGVKMVTIPGLCALGSRAWQRNGPRRRRGGRGCPCAGHGRWLGGARLPTIDIPEREGRPEGRPLLLA